MRLSRIWATSAGSAQTRAAPLDPGRAAVRQPGGRSPALDRAACAISARSTRDPPRPRPSARASDRRSSTQAVPAGRPRRRRSGLLRRGAAVLLRSPPGGAEPGERRAELVRGVGHEVALGGQVRADSASPCRLNDPARLASSSGPSGVAAGVEVAAAESRAAPWSRSTAGPAVAASSQASARPAAITREADQREAEPAGCTCWSHLARSAETRSAPASFRSWKIGTVTSRSSWPSVSLWRLAACRAGRWRAPRRTRAVAAWRRLAARPGRRCRRAARPAGSTTTRRPGSSRRRGASEPAQLGGACRAPPAYRRLGDEVRRRSRTRVLALPITDDGAREVARRLRVTASGTSSTSDHDDQQVGGGEDQPGSEAHRPVCRSVSPPHFVRGGEPEPDAADGVDVPRVGRIVARASCAASSRARPASWSGRTSSGPTPRP